ncbi:hypothetical protein Mapa_009284 [Marchantia paleacea]|nr:hypothetical protein Mapa_009284 [Marchantia paleacea]
MSCAPSKGFHRAEFCCMFLCLVAVFRLLPGEGSFRTLLHLASQIRSCLRNCLALRPANLGPQVQSQMQEQWTSFSKADQSIKIRYQVSDEGGSRSMQ